MNRKKFITAMAALPVTGAALKVSSLRELSLNFEATEKFPVLFLGHGSPMNAIEENEFVDGFRNIGKTLEKPTAILVISAHWETRGTFVTAMENPPTIHDFGGFPQALFDVQYPAPGSPALAQETKRIITKTDVLLDNKWGLDHGAWSVVKHLYPDAAVPVVQMSIDYTQPASYHYELAKELASLRHKGVLIIGSGNMVHNLRMVAWDKLNESGFAWEWALEAKEKMKQYIMEGNHHALIDFKNQGKAFDLAIPTPEHYLPLIYSLALKDKQDDLFLFNDNSVGGSLAMTSLKIG
ncbi:dioxygenase [Sphingobacterium faecium NBRC 15299]|uniref:4,5-DOPA-extradiol-dioxygenase n=1 Tax=Sphingobacterium faecium TaxID=34087 RepID=UPI00119043B3|nr:4,5-DOPA dioxygenase extradiol [Sphingobacterium faecium]GEM63081.1 dioxygenase [Sphingobacterium faecium NBRC 15299]